MTTELHRRLIVGLELESYTILTPDHYVSREAAFPRKGVGEKGERFGRDWTIGTEYNSRPFATIREGLFLLKAGLRKYSRRLYRTRNSRRKGHQLLLVGGWRDRYAGAHIHLSIAGEKLTRKDAKSLAFHLHDHIPLLIAMGANSPVWADELTSICSNRIARASKLYFKPIRRNELTMRTLDEMVYNPARKLKPATLELRVLDSNIPEYVIACVCVVKAAALAWLSGKPAANRITQSQYKSSREEAARLGMKAHLYWNGKRVTAVEYLDKFVWNFREEFVGMDIPHDTWVTMKLLKKRFNGAQLIASAAKKAHAEHPQTWQRRFARRYVRAIDEILAGNSILAFARRLGVELPNLSQVRVGSRRFKIH